MNKVDLRGGFGFLAILVAFFFFSSTVLSISVDLLLIVYITEGKT